MSVTYEDILERMSDKFTELSGMEADRASDIGIRLRVLAGEIYSMYSYIEWLKKQAFPDTAAGESLDKHAAQRGLTRKKGKKARGVITFRLDMPLEYGVTIPEGTICTVSDGSLNYVTTQEAVIERGSVFAFVPAEAENSGEQYNIGAERVNTIVTYFSVGLTINNATSFSGGTSDEEDEALRKRLFESYFITPAGMNKAYFRELATGQNCADSASVYTVDGEAGNIYVAVAGRGTTASSAQLLNATAAVNSNTPLGIESHVQNATLRTVNVVVTVTVKDGYSFTDVGPNVEEAIRSFFYDLSVGEGLIVANLGSVIIGVEGVENYSFTNLADTSAGNAVLITLGTLSVSAA